MRTPLALLVLISTLVSLSYQQQCSATKLCEVGCCSSNGYCGYGPEFCGKGCLSTCDEKSDCNPGWTGSNWSKKEKCTLNVCCSEHGFCGYTEEFCSKDPVDRPSCPLGARPVSRLIGYYEAFALRGRSCMSMEPERIPLGLYTHVIFSFATINPKTFEVAANSGEEELMNRIRALKLVQPDLEIWIAIGGWAFNDPGPTQSTFSDMAASEESTNAFLASLGRLMNKYGFDGVDIDWEYPVAEERHGRPEDYKNAVTFMTSLRRKMKGMSKGISLALPASYWYLQNFDIVALEATVDWFNLMSYDMHGSWDIDNEWTGPWANSHTNMTEIQLAFDLLWRNGIAPAKVTMGLSYYSRTFTLTTPACNDVGCQVSSAGDPGRCSDTAGFLLHPEIVEIMKERELLPQLHRKEAVKSITWDNQWTTFDDVATWRLKANAARSQCISGFMVWAISQDDARASNAKALNLALGRKPTPMPKFEKGNEAPLPAMSPGVCRWTSCFDGCPEGMEEVQRDGHEEIMMDSSICKGLGHGYARFCCPKSSQKPICTWRGHKNSGNCEPLCGEDEVEVGTLKTGCSKKYQVACCQDQANTISPWGQCLWVLTCLDDPEAACPAMYPNFVVSSVTGTGGMPKCKNGKKRAFCCPEPVPYPFNGECKWVPKAGKLEGSEHRNTCEGACPDDYIKVALARDQKLFTDASCEGNLPFCCPDIREYLYPGGDDGNNGLGSRGLDEFEELLNDYMENPTCPAKELHPPLQGHLSWADDSAKRSLIMESSAHEVLQGRSTDCTLDKWNTLVNWGVLMFVVQQSEFDGIRNAWDDIFADSYDEELLHENLQAFLDDYPAYTDRGLVEEALYNPQTLGPAMRRIRRSNQVFCTAPDGSGSNSLRARKAHSHSSATRAVSSYFQDEYTPTIETVWEGIELGDLSLHYARWQWYGGGATGRPGPFLELAYWIGSQPGVDSGSDPYLNRYRDTTPGNSYPGRWVVFHLHIDPGTEGEEEDWYQQIGGLTYFGIVGYTFFHAHVPSFGPSMGDQDVEDADLRDWRVNTNNRASNPTPRDQWFCADQDPQAVWWVGLAPDSIDDPDISEEDREWFLAMQRWGQRLFDGGYMATPGVGLILDAPIDHNGQIMVDEYRPRLITRTQVSAAAGNVSPYTVNWRVDSNGINFFTEPPPPRRR